MYAPRAHCVATTNAAPKKKTPPFPGVSPRPQRPAPRAHRVVNSPRGKGEERRARGKREQGKGEGRTEKREHRREKREEGREKREERKEKREKRREKREERKEKREEGTGKREETKQSTSHNPQLDVHKRVDKAEQFTQSTSGCTQKSGQSRAIHTNHVWMYISNCSSRRVCRPSTYDVTS